MCISCIKHTAISPLKTPIFIYWCQDAPRRLSGEFVYIALFVFYFFFKANLQCESSILNHLTRTHAHAHTLSHFHEHIPSKYSVPSQFSILDQTQAQDLNQERTRALVLPQ